MQHLIWITTTKLCKKHIVVIKCERSLSFTYVKIRCTKFLWTEVALYSIEPVMLHSQSQKRLFQLFIIRNSVIILCF